MVKCLETLIFFFLCFSNKLFKTYFISIELYIIQIDSKQLYINKQENNSMENFLNYEQINSVLMSDIKQIYRRQYIVSLFRLIESVLWFCSVLV